MCVPASLMALSCTAQNLFPFNAGGDLTRVFSLPSKWFLFESWFVNFSFLLPEPGLAWAPWQGSGLRLLAKGGRAPCPSATRFSRGSKITTLLLSRVPTSLPGILALFAIHAAEEAPAAAARARPWGAAGNPNFHGDFQGSQGLLWTGGQWKEGTSPIIRKPVKLSHPVGFSLSVSMRIIYFTTLMSVLLLLFFLPADTII